MTQFYKVIDKGLDGSDIIYYFKVNALGAWRKSQNRHDDPWTYYDYDLQGERFVPVTEDEYNDLVLGEI